MVSEASGVDFVHWCVLVVSQMHDFGEGHDDVSVQTHHCYWEIRTQSLKPFGGGVRLS